MDKIDCIIVGGGIAGLQAAIQLGRYKHNVLVIDSAEGRSVITRGYHNVLGWPDGVSGPELRRLGKTQAEKYGVLFMKDKVISAVKQDGGFLLKTSSGKRFEAKTLFLATGITDNLPRVNGLRPCLGETIYICPDCDGYEVSDKKTVVFGGGNTGAGMALTLTYWTKDLTYINHEKKEIDEALRKKLQDHNRPVIEQTITRIMLDSQDKVTGFELENGEVIPAERGFTGFSGNKLNNRLAMELGIQHTETHHVIADPRTKETNIEGVWAGGDLIAHSEQVTISMGDGSQAVIGIHKGLRKRGQREKPPILEDRLLFCQAILWPFP